MKNQGFVNIILIALVPLVLIVLGIVIYYNNFHKSATKIPLASASPTAIKSPTSNITSTPTPKPTVLPSQTTQSDQGLFTMKVLVLKYFPVTTDGQTIDTTFTGDVGGSLSNARQQTISVTNNLAADLEKASKYLGYKNSSAQPSLSYQIVDTKEFLKPVPFDPNTRIPQYRQLLTDNNICSYVDSQGVSEVWLWAYQGPTFPGSNPPAAYLGISESKMSGPNGDISNSYRSDDMPKCSKTYRVYTFNYGRGTSEALESWGHQFEAELSAVDNHLFRDLFQGPNYPSILNQTGRCGSVHNPPNARFEYDRNNPTPHQSDCLDWNPDGMGSLSSISCQNWGCQEGGDNNNPSLNYMIWMWQNLPGAGNSKTYQGKHLRNFWEVHANFDQVMSQNKTLTP